MKLSRTVAYAVRATIQLAQTNSGAPVPCSRLASEGHMPERFLLQILRNLVTHGILHSTRGVDGGYSLERKPDDISLLDLIDWPLMLVMTSPGLMPARSAADPSVTCDTSTPWVLARFNDFAMSGVSE